MIKRQHLTALGRVTEKPAQTDCFMHSVEVSSQCQCEHTITLTDLDCLTDSQSSFVQWMLLAHRQFLV